MRRSELDERDEVTKANALSSRLLTAAARHRPPVDVTWDEVQAAILRAGPPPRRIRLRTALAVGVALILSSSAASVALTRGGLFRRHPASVSPPDLGARKPAARRARVRVVMKGPGTAAWDEAQQTVSVSGELGGVTTEEGPAKVFFEGRAWDVAPGQPLDFTSSGPAELPRQPPRSSSKPTKPRSSVTNAADQDTRLERDARLAPPSVTGEQARRVEKAEPLLLLPPAWAEEAGVPAGPELALVKEALHDLRVRQDAAAALARLEGHVGPFGDRALEDVAALLRIEALLSLARTREAWVRLEALPDRTVARTPVVLLARAELRALHGHCVEALGDLSRLGRLSAEAWQTRATRVRTWCGDAKP